MQQTPQQQPPVIPEPEKSRYFAQRAETLQLYHQGKFLPAVQNLLQLINTSKAAGHLDANDFILLATIMHAMKQSQGSVDALRECLKYKPNDLNVIRNYATALQFNREYEEVLLQIGSIIAEGKGQYTDYDAMAAALGDLGRLEEARQYGSKALVLRAEILDRLPAAQWRPSVPRKPFNPLTPQKNIIAFSLWGKNPRYIDSAIDNATAIPYIYPSWRARFYCDDSVEPQVCQQLLRLGAEVSIQQSNQSYEGLFWRFAVANDPEVDFFLVRDADAVVNVQERVAVDEWLASDKLFHVMRDYHTHSEVILAGMWGGQANVLPNIIDLANNYKSSELYTRTIDQIILRQCVWPMLQHSVMMHDSQFEFRDGRPFPPYGRLPPNQHIGQSKRV